MISKMETLVIVDRQKDFGNKFGTLYVPGAEETEVNTVNYIEKNHSQIVEVIFTIDWHTSKHCSFKSNGGIWPNHCQQFTEGAGISDALYNVCIKYNIPIKVFKKGNLDDVEEYGAFDVVGLTRFDSGDNDGFSIVANNKAKNSMVVFSTRNIVISGLAGDYCVKSSIENLLKVKDQYDLNIKVFMDGISSIDDGTTIKNFIKENNLEIV